MNRQDAVNGAPPRGAWPGPGAGGSPPIEGLARALGRPAETIALLSPEEGAALAARFEERRAALTGPPPAVVPLVTSTRERVVVEGVLAWLAGRVPPQEAVLLPPGGGGGGARTTAGEVLERALDLLAIDPAAEVRAISPDAGFGLGLAAAADSGAAGEGTIYRLFSWGFRAAD